MQSLLAEKLIIQEVAAMLAVWFGAFVVGVLTQTMAAC